MILTWSEHQEGNAASVIDYLLLEEISKSLKGRRLRLVRCPAPEVLEGSPTLVATFIDRLLFKKKYRCATLSFHKRDIELASFERGDPGVRGNVDGAVCLFLEVAFSGVPTAARPPILVSTHTHIGRLEVSILMPRAINAETGLRNFNPHPPTRGSEADWDAYVDVVNSKLGWTDPRCPLRRQQVTPPSWMKKLAVELSRRQHEDEDFVVPNEDPRFVAWTACENAMRAGLQFREQRVAFINEKLAPLGWGVCRLWHDGLTCGPLDGGGRSIRFRGAALGDGLEAIVDPFDALATRAEELLRAPDRLAAAMRKRAIRNAHLCETELITPPRALDLLKGPRPLQTLAACLARLVDRLRDRLARACWRLLFQRAFQPSEIAKFHTIRQNLERLHDPKPDHTGAPRTHRNLDRLAATAAGPRQVLPGGTHGSVPGGTELHPHRNDDGGEKNGSGSEQVREGRDRGGSALTGEAPTRTLGVPGAETGVPVRSARWTRGHWMILMMRRAQDVLGPCSLSWRVTKGLEEAAIRTPKGELLVAIDRTRPDDAWQASFRQRLQIMVDDAPSFSGSELPTL